MQRRLVLVQMLDELGDAALVVKLVRALRLFAFILDRDANAFVQKGLFAQALGKFVKTKNGVIKNLRVRLEGDLRAALPRLAGLLQTARRRSRARNPARKFCRRARSQDATSRKES